MIDLARKEQKINYFDLCRTEDTSTIDITILDDIIDAEESMLLKNKVEEILGCLSEQQREALFIKYALELNYEEISEILQINPNSVKKLIYRSMKKLRQNIGDNHLTLLLIFLLNCNIYFNP